MTTFAIVFYTGLALGDLGATRWALDRGALELNYQNYQHAAAGSILVAGSLALTDSWLEKKSRRHEALRAAGIIPAAAPNRPKQVQRGLRVAAAIGAGYLIQRSIRNGLGAKRL